MSNLPECANCFEKISWTPAFHDGEPYCCDGCVMGGPCICTYEGPPPSLNTEEILAGVGDSKETAEPYTLNECFNCFESFRRPPVEHQDNLYCCEGCADGGPCICTYDTSPRTPVHDDGESVSRKANRFWDSADDIFEVPKRSAERSLKTNRYWESDKQVLESAELVEAHAIPRELVFSGDTDDHEEHDSEKVQVFVSPLLELIDARMFTTQLESITTIRSVLLTRYEASRATFEIRTSAINEVIKELVDMDYFRVRSLRMTSEGLELVLLPRGVEQRQVQYVRTETITEQFAKRFDDTGDSVEGRALPDPAAQSSEDGDELHPFIYQMGVDVFFNGRHQVEAKGIKGPVHMHSWRVQAILESTSLSEGGSPSGANEAKDIISSFVTPYNQKILNSMSPFDQIAPTAHNIARVIFEHVSTQLTAGEITLKSVRLWESPTSYVEFSGGGASAR